MSKANEDRFNRLKAQIEKGFADVAQDIADTRAEHILECQAILSTSITILLERYRSTATAEDIKNRIFDRDITKLPRDFVHNLTTLFNAPEVDLDDVVPVILDSCFFSLIDRLVGAA
jgi:hypothetical protein